MLSVTSTIWIVLAILFGVALLFSACGFKKFVWFMSIGYGLAVFGIGVALMILGFTGFGFIHSNGMSYPSILLSILLMLYGLRLSGFLIFREAKSASYRKTLESVSGKDEKKMPVFVKATIWIFCAILYVLETYPVTYRVLSYDGTTSTTTTIVAFVGAGISLVALTIETLADLEKSAAKKKNPHEFVSTGLYRWVRCPNYAGEILFWTGMFVSGCDLYKGDYLAWILSIFGYLCILYVMLSGAKRLEGRQNKNYGAEENYQKYIAKTPLLFRCIPLKSLQSWKWVK
ncbi:MAG: DUF1295 domain-containing protein [Eubacteriales bacterium]|nr:DUF1295 domain-containing protein [Eubacteriales bacterium]